VRARGPRRCRGGWSVVVGVHSRGCRRHWRAWGRRVPEREDVLDEGNMTRGVDTSRLDVIATVSAVVAGVAEEDARHGARTELVRRRWHDVGVAEAAEDTKLVVQRWCTEEELVWRHDTRGAARTPVDEVCRRVQGLRPKRTGSCTVN